MTTRIAVIGVQHFHVFGIINHLKAIEGVEVVALAEAEDAVREEMARKYGVPGYADYHRLLAEVPPDAAAVATINREKADAIAACAAAGVHVIADKPICTELAQVAQLRRALRDHPIRLAVLVAGGYGGASQATRALVREQLGEVVQFTSAATHRWRIDPTLGTRPAWNYSRRLYGGAIVVDGIHSLNNLRWLTGREVAAITAAHSNRTMPDHPEFEDNFAILAELDGGGSATISYAWLTPEGEPTHGRSSLTILGTKGQLEIRSTVSEQPHARTASLEEGVVRGAESETILTTATQPAHRISLPPVKAPSCEEDFVASVRDPGYQPALSPEWILESTRLTVLARQSADEHRRILTRET